MYDVPPTEAELALEGDALVRWARNMPPEPKPKRARKLDTTPQLSIDEQIAIAIEDHKALVMAVMAEVVGKIQQRLNHKIENLTIELAGLRTELEVQKRVMNARMAQQFEPRHHGERHVNGHA